MKRLVAAVTLALLMVGPTLSAEYLGDFTDPNGCLTQENAIAAVVGGMTDGTVLEYQTDIVLVFSNPNESVYYRLDFVNDCAATAFGINADELAALKALYGSNQAGE